LQEKKNGLQVLILANDNIGNAGIHALTKYKAIRILDLSGISLSQESLTDLASMKGLSRLTLVGCGVGPDQLRKLEKALPDTRVETHDRAESSLDNPT
jgi:hypothetical protein